MLRHHNYVSVLFPSLLQPIVDLFGLMEKQGTGDPNEVQASPAENGYAASIAVLTVLVIESVCNRVRYVRNDTDRKGTVQTLSELSAGELADEVEELFVLRDVIAHNHVWEATIAEDDSKGLALVAATLRPRYGDEKFARTVDPQTRRTRRLHLDVFPNRIHRQTAVVVLQNASRSSASSRALTPVSWGPRTLTSYGRQRPCRFTGGWMSYSGLHNPTLQRSAARGARPAR